MAGGEWFVPAFGAHYLHLYSHRDEQEAASCVAALERLRPLGEGPVLDLGCGAGRHLPFLARRGVRGAGLDLSAPLLREAARNGAAAAEYPLVRGDMRRLPLRDGSFAAVLSLFTAFGYFGRLAAHDAILQEIGRVLRPGGAWYLDYLDCLRVREELAGGGPAVRERGIGPCRARESRRLDADRLRVLKDVEITPLPGRVGEAAALGVPPDGLRYTEQVALFEPGELDAMARRHGLRRRAAAGGYDGSPLRPGSSQRWILVYVKQDA